MRNTKTKENKVNTIGLMPKASKEKFCGNDDVAEQLNVIDSFRKLVESGDVAEFIISGIGEDRQVIIASYSNDVVDSLGILEMTKHALLSQQQEEAL